MKREVTVALTEVRRLLVQWEARRRKLKVSVSRG